jgi:hypothetical protein
MIQTQCEVNFDKLGHWVLDGSCKDLILEKIVVQRVQVVICTNTAILAGSNFSQGTPPPLQTTQNLLVALRSNDVVQDVEDTQLTSLSL